MIKTKAKLILQDGTEFIGKSFEYRQATIGEVVFNTGMVGYPETMADPSYRGQILVCTYPLIGNYGIPGNEKEDSLFKYFESDEIHVRALIVSDYSSEYDHWNSKRSLSDWMIEHKIPGINGIDTRMLTRHLREKGTMPGKIIFDEKDNIDFQDVNSTDLVSEVSVKAPIENTRRAIEKNVPILGICLGSQILALAAGAKTYKLKYGHRGHNQPCNENGTKRCYITSQNHGYAVESETLPEDWREWFINDNDGTNEGIIHISKPFFAAQFHPEASPGPDDSEFIFDMFVRTLN